MEMKFQQSVLLGAVSGLLICFPGFCVPFPLTHLVRQGPSKQTNRVNGTLQGSPSVNRVVYDNLPADAAPDSGYSKGSFDSRPYYNGVVLQEKPSYQSYGLRGFPAGESYDGNAYGSPYRQYGPYAEYSPSQNYQDLPYLAPRSYIQRSPQYSREYEVQVEYEYEPRYGYPNYANNEPYPSFYKSSYPYRQGYDPYASPYYAQTQALSQIPEYGSGLQNYRNDFEESYVAPRSPIVYPTSISSRSYGTLYNGIYDSPNTIPYNTHDYKKYPYGFSGSATRSTGDGGSYKGFSDQNIFEEQGIDHGASVSRPLAFRPRFVNQYDNPKYAIRKARTGSGLRSAAISAQSPVSEFSTIQAPLAAAALPIYPQTRSFFPQMLNPFIGGGDGSYERLEFENNYLNRLPGSSPFFSKFF